MIARWISVVCFAAVFSVSACVSDEANRYYGGQRFAAKPPEDVVVLREAPSQPYVVIADLQSRGDTVKSLQKKAADIGADAVIVSFLGGSFNPNDKWAGKDSQAGTYTRAIGVAIKYK